VSPAPVIDIQSLRPSDVYPTITREEMQTWCRNHRFKPTEFRRPLQDEMYLTTANGDRGICCSAPPSWTDIRLARYTARQYIPPGPRIILIRT